MTQTNEQTDAEYLDGLVGGMAGLGIDAARLRTIADKLRNSASEGTPHTPTAGGLKIGDKVVWHTQQGDDEPGTIIEGPTPEGRWLVDWDGLPHHQVFEKPEQLRKVGQSSPAPAKAEQLPVQAKPQPVEQGEKGKLWTEGQCFTNGSGMTRWWIEGNSVLFGRIGDGTHCAGESFSFRTVADFEAAIERGEMKPMAKPHPAPVPAEQPSPASEAAQAVPAVVDVPVETEQPEGTEVSKLHRQVLEACRFDWCAMAEGMATATAGVLVERGVLAQDWQAVKISNGDGYTVRVRRVYQTTKAGWDILTPPATPEPR